MSRTSAAIVAAAIAGLLTLSACGSTSGQPVAEPAAEEPVVDTQSTTLVAAQVAALGAVVTDQNGRTLYRFDKDKAKPSVSNCNDDCAVAWPPVLVTVIDDVKLTNVDKTLVGTVEREDGSTQLTLGGWALYRYKDDTKAGDVKGQGIGGTWFASTPEGKKAAAKPAATTTIKPPTTTKPAPVPTTDPGDGY